MINTFTEADFRKATLSEPNQSCVHVAWRGGSVEIRDSKTIFSSAVDHRLALTADQFEGFLTNMRETAR